MRRWLAVPALLFLTGCAMTVSSLYRLTADEQVYLDEARRHPLEFKLIEEEAADARGRAQTFIATYASMKLQTVTDYVIETYNPADYGYGYSVTASPVGDSVRFSVRCAGGGPAGGRIASDNAHMLAYYMATSRPPASNRLVAR